MNKLILIIVLSVASLFADVGTVKKIIDGDTIRLIDSNGKEVKVRLDKYDTPEKYMSTKAAWDSYHCRRSTYDIMLLGKLATTKLSELIPVGTNIEYKVTGLGDYGRPIIDIMIPVIVSDEMISSGYTYVSKYNRDDNDSIELMAESKLKRKGMWSVDYSLMKCLSEKALGDY